MVVSVILLSEKTPGTNHTGLVTAKVLLVYTRSLGLFEYAKNAINAIWKLTLRHLLTESLKLKYLRKTIAYVLNNKYE